MNVTDQEAMDAQILLSREEGLFVELASAVTIAALKKLPALSSKIGNFSSCCVILTGTGLLDSEKAIESLDLPPAYPVDFDWETRLQKFFTD